MNETDFTTFPWKSVFFIRHNDVIIEKTRKWCMENCKTQWMLATTSNIQTHGPINLIPPIGGSTPYSPPISYCHHTMLIFSFESEEEAMGFKMMFQPTRVNNT